MLVHSIAYSFYALQAQKRQKHAFVLTEYKKEGVLCQVRKNESRDSKKSCQGRVSILKVRM